MWKYVAILSYRGTGFWGWQKQKKSGDSEPSVSETRAGVSIQETIEAALAQMTGEMLSVVGSGRTDSGVHAVGQVAHFVLKKKEWDPGILQRGLNGILPMSIRVVGVKKVPLEFHAQKSAIRKQYSYYFQQGPSPLPHVEPYSWWIRKNLDIQAMNDAAQFLLGEHDFKPFRAAGAKPGSSVRKIFEFEVTPMHIGFPGILSGGDSQDFFMVRVRIMGSGFLKQMVRGIAGTLLQIGEGHRPSSDMQEILCTGDRQKVGPTAPARALWLERVWYPEDNH